MNRVSSRGIRSRIWRLAGPLAALALLVFAAPANAQQVTSQAVLDRVTIVEGQTRTFQISNLTSRPRYHVHASVAGSFTAEAGDITITTDNLRGQAQTITPDTDAPRAHRNTTYGTIRFEVTANSDSDGAGDETFGVRLCTTADCTAGTILGEWTVTVAEPAADTTLNGTGATVTVPGGGAVSVMEDSRNRDSRDRRATFSIDITTAPTADIVVVAYTETGVSTGATTTAPFARINSSLSRDYYPRSNNLHDPVRAEYVVGYWASGATGSQEFTVISTDNAADTPGGTVSGTLKFRVLEGSAFGSNNYTDGTFNNATVYSGITIPDLPVHVTDDDEPTRVRVLAAASEDNQAMEGNTNDTAKFLVKLERPLAAGESITAPLRFIGATLGTNFTVALDSAGSDTGASYADTPDTTQTNSPGAVTFTGAGAREATLEVTAIMDSDSISHRLEALVPEKSDRSKPFHFVTHDAGGVETLHGGACAARACDSTQPTNRSYFMDLNEAAAGITIVDDEAGWMSEGTSGYTYGIRLSAMPASGSVTVRTTVSPSSVANTFNTPDRVFTTANWQEAQNVTIRPALNSADAPNSVITVTHDVISAADSNYSGLADVTYELTVVDNDASTIAMEGDGVRTTVSSTAISNVMVEGDATLVDRSLTIKLSRALAEGEYVRVPLKLQATANGHIPDTTDETDDPAELEPPGEGGAWPGDLHDRRIVTSFRGPRASANVAWPPHHNDFVITATGPGITYEPSNRYTPPHIGYGYLEFRGAGAQTARFELHARDGFDDGEGYHESFFITIFDESENLSDPPDPADAGLDRAPWDHNLGGGVEVAADGAQAWFGITDDEGGGTDAIEVPNSWPLLPPGLSPGDTFRLLYVTNAETAATSTAIATYDAFVRAEITGAGLKAGGVEALKPYAHSFRAIASTGAEDSQGRILRNAQALVAGEHAMFGPWNDDHPNEPIYWVGGGKVADDKLDFVDNDRWDSESPRRADGTTATVDADGYWTGTHSKGGLSGSQGFGSDRRTATRSYCNANAVSQVGGDELLVMGSTLVHVGYLGGSGRQQPLGPLINDSNVGNSVSAAACTGAPNTELRPMYALSGVFSVGSEGVTVDGGTTGTGNNAVTVANPAAAEGNDITFTVTLPAAAPTGGVSVPYTFTDGRGIPSDPAHAIATGASGGTGADYANDTGSVAIAQGDTTGTFTVATTNDSTYEGDHYFTVTLGTPTAQGGETAPGLHPTGKTAIGIITDAADRPAFGFSPATATAGEGDGTISVTVTKTGTTEVASSVYWTTADGTGAGGAAHPGDYTADAGYLQFAPGDASRTIAIDLVDDAAGENAETFKVQLSEPSDARLGSASEATVTLNDDDGGAPPPPGAGVTVSPVSLALTELGAAAEIEKTYTVVLDTDPGADVTITVTNGDGTAVEVDTDSGMSGNQDTLTFTHGGSGNWNTARTVTVRALNDADAANESFNLTHAAAVSDTGNPYHGIAIDPVAVATADAGHGVAVSESSLSVAENDETATYTVALKSRPGGAVTITPTSGAAATATVSPVSLSFGNSDWNTPKTFTVTGKGAGSTSISHAVSTGTTAYPISTTIPAVAVTVTEVIIPTLKVEAEGGFAVAEGDAFSFTLTLSQPATGAVTLTVGATVTWDCMFISCPDGATLASASDVSVVTARAVNFAAGETTKTVSIMTTEDSVAEGTELFVLDVSNLSPTREATIDPDTPADFILFATPHWFVRVLDDDTTPTVGIAGGSAVTEGEKAQFTVSAAQEVAADLSVDLTVSDASGSDFIAAANEGSKSVTIAKGAKSAIYEVQTVGDSTAEANGDITVAIAGGADYTTGTPSSAMVTVNDDDGAAAVDVTLSASDGDADGNAVEGASDATGHRTVTLTLSRALTAGETVTVPLTVRGATVATDYTFGLQGTNTGVTLLTSNPHSAQDPAARFAAGATTATLRFTPADNGDRTQPAISIGAGTPAASGGVALGDVTGAPLVFSIVDDETGAVVVPPDWALKPSGLGGGDTFRLIFITSETRTAESADIDDYNTWARGVVARGGHASLLPYGGLVTVVGSTLIVDARENTGMWDPSLNSGSGGHADGSTGDSDPGAKVYWLAAPPARKVADNYHEFYGSSGWDGGSDQSGRDTTEAGASRTNNLNVWSGSYTTGTRLWQGDPGSNIGLGGSTAAIGHATSSNVNSLYDSGASPRASSLPMFGMSPVFEVAAPELSFGSGGTFSVAEGGTATVTVSSSIAAPAAATVNYTVTGGTATGGADYEAPSGAFALTAGATSHSFTIDTTQDTLVEGDETITVRLDAGAGYTVGSPDTATVTITDDDTAVVPVLSVALPSVEGVSRNTAGQLVFAETGAGSTQVSFDVTLDPAPSANFTACVRVTESGGDRVAAGAEGVKAVTVPSTGTLTHTVAWTDTAADDRDSVVTVEAVAPGTAGCSAANGTYTVSTTEASDAALVRDDEATTVSLLSGDASMTEGDATDTAALEIWLGRQLHADEAVVVPFTFATTTGARLPGNATPDFAVTASGAGVALANANTATPSVTFTGHGTDTVRTARLTLTPVAGRDDGDTAREEITATLAPDSVLGSTSGTGTTVGGGAMRHGTDFARSLTLEDDEAPAAGLTFSVENLRLLENGSATYTVRLNQEPSASVSIFLGRTGADAVAATVSPSSMTLFPGTGTASSWNAPQTVTVTGADEPGAHRNRALAIRHTVTTTDSSFSGYTHDLPVEVGDAPEVEAWEGWVRAEGDRGDGATLSRPDTVSSTPGIWPRQDMVFGSRPQDYVIRLSNRPEPGGTVTVDVARGNADVQLGLTRTGPWHNSLTVTFGDGFAAGAAAPNMAACNNSHDHREGGEAHDGTAATSWECWRKVWVRRVGNGHQCTDITHTASGGGVRARTIETMRIHNPASVRGASACAFLTAASEPMAQNAPAVEVPTARVANLEVAKVDADSASASWDAVEHATGYEVAWDALDGGGQSIAGGLATGVAGTSETIAHHAPGAASLRVTVAPEYVDGDGDTQTLANLAATATLDLGSTGTGDGDSTKDGGGDTDSVDSQTPNPPPAIPIGSCVSVPQWKTVKGYYDSNANRSPDYGANWYRVLIAYQQDRTDKTLPDWVGQTAEPTAAYTAEEAENGEKVWRGWTPVRKVLECLERTYGTSTSSVIGGFPAVGRSGEVGTANPGGAMERDRRNPETAPGGFEPDETPDFAAGSCVSPQLRSDAVARANETWRGPAHVERWLRVARTFSGGANDATIVTPAEAGFHAAAGQPGWLPVADALRCMEQQSLREALSR